MLTPLHLLQIFLAFMETWLKPEISDSKDLPNNFDAYRTDRSSRRGGSVPIAVTNSLTSQRIHSDTPMEIEFISEKFPCNHSQYLLHVPIFHLALI